VSFVKRTTNARAGSTVLAFSVLILLAKAGATHVWPERYVPTPAFHAYARIVPDSTWTRTYPTVGDRCRIAEPPGR
jgi:hypothetical protein